MSLLLLLAFAFVSPVTPPPGYEPAIARVPSHHWALVRGVVLTDRGRVNYPSATITLPRRPKASTLYHEVGHLVMAPRSPLGALWCRTFWPDGRPVGTLSSRHAGDSCREDAAVSYEELIEHGCLIDPPRERWLREHVFRPGELPPCAP